MRVLRLFSRLNIGGPSVHVILLSHGLRPLGYDTRLVVGRESAREGNLFALAEEKGVACETVAGLGREIAPLSDLLALAGLWLGRRDRWTQGVALAAAVLLFFMSPISAPLWRASRLLQITQHPGRVFSTFATLELLAIVVCVGRLTRLPGFTARRQALAALLVLLGIAATARDRYRIREGLDYARFRFEAAGLTHLLAVSGQNVAFVLAVAAPLLRRLHPSAPLGRRRAIYLPVRHPGSRLAHVTA